MISVYDSFYLNCSVIEEPYADEPTMEEDSEKPAAQTENESQDMFEENDSGN